MERVKITQEEQGFRITLSNPKKKNAIDEKMIDEITHFFSSDRNKFSGKNFVVLEGEGDIFCSGGDLNWMLEKGQSDLDTNIIDAIKLAHMYKSIWDCPIPVVLKLLGGAWGGGVGFIAVSDIVIAQKNAKIRLPEVKIGLVPAVISVFLIRKIGLSRFLDLALLAREISAEEGEKFGLVNYTVPKEKVEKITNKIVTELIQTPSYALESTKKLSRLVVNESIESGMKHAAEQIAQARANPETQKKLISFLQKKK
ncbi:MAG: enoyl-CoA hydratase-related protein [Candidatus Calescibacterium sp.]|nr:enoyl-CoA hydratase-related protein [Candidatus Calescibacterium sp.]MCX7734472.1 enoyl-CoA hydratase-related protein [bacterium]MDW8087334.1 enoyl-CoA hydratase-related protein [Candidatus Calescibacterium sp.]